MDLYLGKPHKLSHPRSLGYALSHEMKDSTVIESYKTMSKLVLDNGADELGEGQGGARLAYLAGLLQPNWIILPDVLHKDKKTRKRSIEFYESMKDTDYHGKYMAVIQAKDLQSGLESYRFWDQSGIVDRIGVTYDTKIKTEISEGLPLWAKRLGFLEHLTTSREFTKGNGTGIHMLGTLEVRELFTLFRHPMFKKILDLDLIHSHDTTAPYACPTKFKALRNISFGRAKDWTPLDFNRTYTREEQEVIAWNVACYLAACKIPKEQWDQYLGFTDTNLLWGEFEKYYG